MLEPRDHPLDYRATVLDQSQPRTYKVSFDAQLPSQCMRRLDAGHVVNLDTGELRPHMCGANSCSYCGKVKRRQVIRAVGAAEPTACFTLTLAGDEFPVIQNRMKNLLRRLRRSGYPIEWVWLVECNVEWGRHFHHVHGMAYRATLDPGTFLEHAQGAAFGRESQFQELTNPPVVHARYLWGSDSYRRANRSRPRKHRVIDLPHFLWMNGHRFQHSSTRFWRLDGEYVPGGMDEVLRRLRSRS